VKELMTGAAKVGILAVDCVEYVPVPSALYAAMRPTNENPLRAVIVVLKVFPTSEAADQFAPLSLEN
jgi:hypothetical protein